MAGRSPFGTGNSDANARRSFRRKRRVVEAGADAADGLVEFRRKFPKRDAVGHALVGVGHPTFRRVVTKLRMGFGVDAHKEAGRMKDDGGNVLAFEHRRAHLRRAVRLLRLFADIFPISLSWLARDDMFSCLRSRQ